MSWPLYQLSYRPRKQNDTAERVLLLCRESLLLHFRHLSS